MGSHLHRRAREHQELARKDSLQSREVRQVREEELPEPHLHYQALAPGLRERGQKDSLQSGQVRRVRWELDRATEREQDQLLGPVRQVLERGWRERAGKDWRAQEHLLHPEQGELRVHRERQVPEPTDSGQ